MKITLNFFTRPQNDLSTTTFVGAVLSLLTILLFIFFTIYLTLFRSSVTERNFIIQNENISNEITVNFDILFLHSPCAALRLQKEDPINFKQITIHRGLSFNRVNNNKKIPDSYIDPIILSQYPDEDETVKILLTGLKDKEQCRVKGTFEIERIPGSFSINHELVYTYLSQVKQNNLNLYQELNLAHKMTSLYFGKEKENKVEGITYSKEESMTCLYYLKLIPKDGSENYQYSLNHECDVLIKVIIENRR